MPGPAPTRTGASMLLPLVLLLVLGAIWGGNPAFSKALVTNGISPPAVVFWQTLGAGILLSIVCLVRRTPIRLNRRAVIYYIVIGMVGALQTETASLSRIELSSG